MSLFESRLESKEFDDEDRAARTLGPTSRNASMKGRTRLDLRLFAWRHTNAIKAKAPHNSWSLIKFTPSYAYANVWETPENRKLLRDAPPVAIDPPYFVTTNVYGNPWSYIFLVSDKPVTESDVCLDANSDVAMLWSDRDAGETHFRYWKRAKLLVSLVAGGTEDADGVDIRSFAPSGRAKNLFRYARNLGNVLTSVTSPLLLRLDVQNPLVPSNGRFRLRGDPADYDSVSLHALHPLEQGESPPSDRLLDALNKGDVRRALDAIADGASRYHVPGLRSSPLDLACSAGHHQLIKPLISVGCPLDKDRPLIADSIFPFNPEAKVLRVVETLAELGASVNAIDARGMTALHNAVMAKFPSVVRRLVELGADRKRHDECLSKTPLQRAHDLPDSPEKEAIIAALSDAG